ncbi:MAG: T9SS type A sorting domain-containing protein, partial [Saprospiraceae bacterium]|nr:T9SS type A sorting domain-containing protein [Saprospiraceae bacterium]
NYWKPISTGNYDGQIFLTKINTYTGDTLWTKELGQSFRVEEGLTIRSINVEGVVLCGITYPSNNTEHSKILLIKADSLGNLTFRKEYTTDGTKNHYAYSLTQTLDGGFLIFGFRNYIGPYPGGNTTVNNIDMVLIKTDTQGNQQWAKVYPPWEWRHNLFFGWDIQPLADGTFLTGAGKGYALFQPDNTFSAKYFLARITENGEFSDSLTLPDWHELCRINRLKPSSDGNFWAIGAEKDSQNLGQTSLIMKITPELEVLWKREYRVSPPESMLHEMFYEAVEMPDKGFVLCGTAFGLLEDSTNQNGWVIRVDSLGCLEPGCHLNSPVEEPPAAVPDIGLALSPNPTTGQVHLALTHEGAVLLGVRVLDVQGRTVSDIQYKRSAGWRECDLDLGAEPAGVYVVQVHTSEGAGARKVIKL